MVALLPKVEKVCSKRLMASLNEPSLWLAMYSKTSLDNLIFSALLIFSSEVIMSVFFILLKAICVVLLLIVSITLSGSVVASIKITCSGGSSRVFKNAFEAALESICTSSRMNTLFFPGLLAIKLTLSLSSRTSSTLL